VNGNAFHRLRRGLGCWCGLLCCSLFGLAPALVAQNLYPVYLTTSGFSASNNPTWGVWFVFCDSTVNGWLQHEQNSNRRVLIGNVVAYEGTEHRAMAWYNGATRFGPCFTVPASGNIELSISLEGTSSNHTNRRHCVEWVNDTGLQKRAVLYDPCEPDALHSSFTIEAGAVFSRCWTNTCLEGPSLYIQRYVGQPRDDWDSDGTTNTTVDIGVVGTAVGTTPGPNNSYQPPFSPGTGGPALTNAVNYWSPTNVPALGGSGGLTGTEFYRGIDAVIRSSDAHAREIVGAIRGASNGIAGGVGTNIFDSGPIVHAVTNAGGDIVEAIGGLTNLLGSLDTNAWGLVNVYDSALASENGTGWRTELHEGFSPGSEFWTGLAQDTFFENTLNLNFYLPFQGTSELGRFDLRPQSWPGWVRALMDAVKVVLSLFIVASLYWALWMSFNDQFSRLLQSSVGVGKSATSVTVGGVVALPVKFAAASIVTLGLAGLPTLFAASLVTADVVGVFDQPGFAAAAVTAAGVVDTDVGAAGVAWASVLGRSFPLDVLMVAILNFIGWQITKIGFEAIWLTVVRLLPVATVLCLVASCLGADVTIDNRTGIPVAVLDGQGASWFAPGVHRVDLPSEVSVTAGASTNGSGVFFVAGAVNRCVVRASSTNGILVDVYQDRGFHEGFNGGATLGGGIVALLLAVVFIRRALGIAFGRMDDGG